MFGIHLKIYCLVFSKRTVNYCGFAPVLKALCACVTAQELSAPLSDTPAAVADWASCHHICLCSGVDLHVYTHKRTCAREHTRMRSGTEGRGSTKCK